MKQWVVYCDFKIVGKLSAPDQKTALEEGIALAEAQGITGEHVWVEEKKS